MTTHRERMLAVLQHQAPDHIPWVPRLELWYRANLNAGTLPPKYRGWDLRSIYHDQGLGDPAKRGGQIVRSVIEGVEVITRQKGNETRIETVTPVGTVSTLRRGSPELRAQGIGSLEVEHMIKGPADYPVVEWLYEHTRYAPTYEEFSAYDMECGDDGIPQAALPWEAPGQLFRGLIGWEQCFYHLYDYPQQVERLLAAITESYWEMHRLVAQSPALIVAYGAHFHTQMTPPPIFRQFFLPHLKEVCDFYHAHGKLVQFHGDADVTGLEEMILNAGYDIAECLVTAPMVKVSLEHLRQVWGNRIIIWGGLPSILLCDPFSDEDLVQYMHQLFGAIAPGDAFILGVGDMVMPTSHWERFERVGAMVREYGNYPIE